MKSQRVGIWLLEFLQRGAVRHMRKSGRDRDMLDTSSGEGWGFAMKLPGRQEHYGFSCSRPRQKHLDEVNDGSATSENWNACLRKAPIKWEKVGRHRRRQKPHEPVKSRYGLLKWACRAKQGRMWESCHSASRGNSAHRKLRSARDLCLYH